MYNWNDIQVEQAIAQERYQVIVQARQGAKNDKPGTPVHRQVLKWLQGLWVAWGQSINPRGKGELIRPSK